MEKKDVNVFKIPTFNHTDYAYREAVNKLKVSVRRKLYLFVSIIFRCTVIKFFDVHSS